MIYVHVFLMSFLFILKLLVLTKKVDLFKKSDAKLTDLLQQQKQ